jgi:hypothetical protein
MDNPQHVSSSLVLVLAGHEVSVVIDALVAFANECEAEGDISGYAPICDYVAERCRRLDGLTGIGPELMKFHGLGRFKNRPQG